MFFVQKEDGSLQLVTNYLALNAITVKNQYPLPFISKLLNKLSRANNSFKMTLLLDKFKLVYQKHTKKRLKNQNSAHGSVVMNFGMINTPSTFVTLINNIFKSL